MTGGKSKGKVLLTIGDILSSNDVVSLARKTYHDITDTEGLIVIKLDREHQIHATFAGNIGVYTACGLCEAAKLQILLEEVKDG